MLASKLLKIQIVEDDAVQAEVLKDKLVESNPMSSIEIFSNGSELFKSLMQGVQKKYFYLIVLDYFLQTKENSETINGFEIVKQLYKTHPNIKVVLHSAYESDDSTRFIKIKEDYPNVIEYIKKSEHAHLSIQNLIRFNFMEWQLKRKKRRLLTAFIVFISILLLSGFHFLSSFLAV